jgi:50S ribosomal subunit-associated GTPase HflX
MKCSYPKCENDGALMFRGRPGHRYCVGHYELLARRIYRINAEMRRIREQKRLEAEDNQPARQPTSI